MKTLLARFLRRPAGTAALVAALAFPLLAAGCGSDHEKEGASTGNRPDTTTVASQNPSGTEAAPTRVDPNDETAVARLAEGYEIEMPPFQEPARHRGAGKELDALLLWPQRDVRLEGLYSYAIEVGEEYGFDGDLGTLEFHKGAKTLWAGDKPFDPKSMTETGVIPNEVRQALKAGDTVTWGLYFPKKSKKKDVKAEFKIVREDKAEKQIARVEADPRLERQMPIVRQILVAKALENYRLYTESLVKNIELANANPTSLLPLQGIVVALQRLDLKDSRLFTAVAPFVTGHGRADSASTASTGAGAGGAKAGAGGGEAKSGEMPGGVGGGESRGSAGGSEQAPGKGGPEVASVPGAILGADSAKTLALHVPPNAAQGSTGGGVTARNTGPTMPQDDNAPGAAKPLHPGGSVPPGIRGTGAPEAPAPGTPPNDNPPGDASGGTGTPAGGAKADPLEAKRAADRADEVEADAARAKVEATNSEQSALAALDAAQAAGDAVNAAQQAVKDAQEAETKFVPTGNQAADDAARDALRKSVQDAEKARDDAEHKALAAAAGAHQATQHALEAQQKADELAKAAEQARRLADALAGATTPPKVTTVPSAAQLTALQEKVDQLEKSAEDAHQKAVDLRKAYEDAAAQADQSHDPVDFEKAFKLFEQAEAAARDALQMDRTLLETRQQLEALKIPSPPR